MTDGPRPRQILTAAAFDNALTTLMAVGGSTNLAVHLIAIARRAGVPLDLFRFHQISERVPLLVDCKPSGEGYLEDLHHAGGVPALLKELAPLLELDTVGVTGRPLGEALDDVPALGDWQTTIRPLADPLGPTGALRVLRGSLAPDGAILKTAAASPSLLQHSGPVAVFEGPDDVARRIDDPALGLTPEHVLVMRNAGPVAAGMPEAGALSIPRYLAEAGVKDMVRVSDARMSGTAYGTIVLHCAPEAAAGGPLARVRDGDTVTLDVDGGQINIDVSDDVLSSRQLKSITLPERGWPKLHADHVLQADRGADLDFLLED